jgi:hypothetical protein
MVAVYQLALALPHDDDINPLKFIVLCALALSLAIGAVLAVVIGIYVVYRVTLSPEKAG